MASVLASHGIRQSDLCRGRERERGYPSPRGPASLLEVAISEAFGVVLEHSSGRRGSGVICKSSGVLAAEAAALAELTSTPPTDDECGSTSGGALADAPFAAASAPATPTAEAVSLQDVMQSVGVSRAELHGLLARMHQADLQQLEARCRRRSPPSSPHHPARALPHHPPLARRCPGCCELSPPARAPRSSPRSSVRLAPRCSRPLPRRSSRPPPLPHPPHRRRLLPTPTHPRRRAAHPPSTKDREAAAPSPAPASRPASSLSPSPPPHPRPARAVGAEPATPRACSRADPTPSGSPHRRSLRARAARFCRSSQPGCTGSTIGSRATPHRRLGRRPPRKPRARV